MLLTERFQRVETSRKKTKGKVAGVRQKKAKEGTSGPSVQSAGPSGPCAHAAGPTGPCVNDAGPSVKVAGVRQKRKKQKTKAREVEVVVSEGSQVPHTQLSQN